MNGLEKSIHELINILVQYEATTHKSAPVVLVGKASTSEAKDKDAGRWKRKKEKGKVTTATASAEGAPATASGKGKGKGRVGGSQRSKANDVRMHCQGKGHWKRECPQLLSNPDTGYGAHICNNLQMLERSRKLSKDEMILRLGDGNAIAAEALWHTRLGHISKDMIRKLVDSKSLEIDDLDNLPTCQSCLKGKMTKKPFVGQSAVTNGLLNLIDTDVCGPLNTLTRGGFSYFITFTDDHSRYGYVYLMRYKFEAFGRFKEYRIEVENQTGHKTKALQSDRGGEYLSGEFIDYFKENEILSRWTPLGTPQMNSVAERRNRTLLDIV
ncbi:UNVERIFIED_CONTAM: Transposon Ty2-B Gag-Pol polyprotein [Sesamum radiatum]|uniref:Transposon Ty2-B Gag-Pol polyprotein n=1 Tax=Sesamum radiatum TaxID=300843 RepID=A0AAW2LB04_SESRA